MFEALSTVYVVHVKEDARQSSVLVREMKFSVQQNVTKILVVAKIWRNKKC